MRGSGSGPRAGPGLRSRPAPRPHPRVARARDREALAPVERERAVVGTVHHERDRECALPLEHAHKLVESPGFRADGVLLAYRQGRVAGFCRNELHATRGEVGTLGTVPAARGIGLGRALLRWGVGWLERESTLPVTLMVDGANDGALALYRSEGFAVTRTRHAWMRPGGGA